MGYYDEYKEKRRSYQRKYEAEHIEDRKDLCKCGAKKFKTSKQCKKCYRASENIGNKKLNKKQEG